MDGSVILISGNGGAGYQAMIKMTVDSQPLEVVIDYDGTPADLSEKAFDIKIHDSLFPMAAFDGVIKLDPAGINLDAGIYPFSISMDSESIMQGYFEWQ